VPSSAKPTAQEINSYSVPPDDPKYIAIQSIGVNKTMILKLGLTAGGAVAVPGSIYETGWYDGSAKPGQNGAVFIYGHVSNWTARGVFYNLKKLKPGDKIVVTRGDNKTFAYQVVVTKIYHYDSVNMKQVLLPIDSRKPGLSLMTCTGQINKGTSEFNERLVVYASLM
jgi:LPXTG-site transpeptidase (sortase) family protein